MIWLHELKSRLEVLVENQDRRGLLELCELAAKERDPIKFNAQILELNRIFSKADRIIPSNPSAKNNWPGHHGES